MEVLRGAVNIIFGIILLAHPNFTIRILFFALGVYLIIDGTLDIFKIATGKRGTQRKFTNYLFGLISILLGLISFFSPSVTLFFIGIVIAGRIFIRGFRVIIDARRSRHRYEGLAWLFGMLLMLFGIAILLEENTRSFTIFVFVIFIVLYAICDGIYLVVRGLLLRFAAFICHCKEICNSGRHSRFARRSSPNDKACNCFCTASRGKWFGTYWLGFRVEQWLV